MTKLLAVAVAALGCACGRSPLGPAEVVIASAAEEPMKIAALALPVALAAGPARAEVKPGMDECVMHIEQEGQYLHAFYDSGVCYPPDEDPAAWHPLWVQVDFQTTLLAFEVMDYPHGRRADNNRGWYMKPNGPAGTFQMQARSGYNNGRADVTISVGRRGFVVK
jgi:hypothetical protein